MSVRRPRFPVIAAVFLMIPFALVGRETPVRVILSESTSISLEMNLADFRFEDRIAGSRLVREIKIRDWGMIGNPGDPALPATGALIEVPSRGNVRLTILSASSEPIYGFEAPATDRPPAGDEEDALPRGETPRGPAFFQNAFYPGPLVCLSETLRLRGISVARVQFRPFQWNPATGELRVYRKIRVRADFDEPLPEGARIGEGDEFSALAGAALLNRSTGPASPPLRPSGLKASGIASQNRLRLEIRESGIYRLGYAEVEATGVPMASLQPASFRLFRQSHEVAFSFHGQSGGSWGPGDYLEFYGEKIDSEYTNANVYWLLWESGSGISMASRSLASAGTGERTTTFCDTLRLEENLVPWFQAPEADAVDHWFWAKLTAPADLSIPFTLPDDTLIDNSTARITAYFQGRSTAAPHPNHRTQLSLNQSKVSDEQWDDDRVFVQATDIPQSLLQTGANILRVDAIRASTGDVCYFNWAVLEFRRGLNARQNEILFAPDGPGEKTFEVGGFSSPDILAYDVSDPERPIALSGFAVAADGGSFGIRFDLGVDGTERFLVLASSRIRQVVRSDYVEAGRLGLGSNRADLILIAPRDLQAAAVPLMAAQAARRLRPVFTAVEDIFDEFGAGIPDPAAIKSFLQTAYGKWQRPAPLYVLLMGDATYDYKDFLSLGKANQVPARFTWMNDTGLTPDDNWYACVDGDDGLPDLFIGRIPGGTPEAALQTAQKLATFELSRRSPPRSAVLAADDGDFQFESINDQIVPLLPPGFAAQKIYLDDYADKNQASLDLIAAINAGTFLVHFAGHGNVTLWTGELLLDNAKVADLGNSDRLALFCAYTCNNGYFANAPGYCLAETLIAAADKGAFAFLASTSSGLAWVHEIMALATARSLFQIRAASLGAIFIEAKLDAFARGASLDSLAKFTLFGDPSQRMEIR